MCGKPEVNTSVLNSEDEDSGQELQNGKGDSDSSAGEEDPTKLVIPERRKNETPEEKLERRRLERRRRKLFKRQKKGGLVPTKQTPKKVLNLFNRVWDEESAWVTRVMQCLPEVRQPGLLMEEDERAEEYITTKKRGKELKDDDREKEKARQRIRNNLQREGVQLTGERAKSYQELKERLQQKLAGKITKPNVIKREKKLKKKLRQKEKAKESNKGKKLISQSASSAGASSSGTGEDGVDVKPETREKTPLKKKPVVKSNGEIVYSKFDFISSDARGTEPMLSSSVKLKKGGKPTAGELLKKVEKQEKQISKLAAQGKQSEAVDLAVSQKWDTALKRADGVKVRDDAYLLKKTIKKQEKLKQLTKKKWKERVDRVEKLKEQRQQKRRTNIQSRKDDKKKRVKKLLRKRGRIA